MTKELLIKILEDEGKAEECMSLLNSKLKEQEENFKGKQKEKSSAEIEKLQEEMKKMTETHTKELKDLKIFYEVDKSLSGAKAIHNTAVKPFLADFIAGAKIGEDGNVEGLAEQIQQLVEGERTSFLFQSAQDNQQSNQLVGMTPTPIAPTSGAVDIATMGYTKFNQMLNDE